VRFPVLSSVRARATFVGVLVVGAALAVGALGLIALLRSSMTEGVETTARAQLNDVASLLRSGELPAVLPAGRGDTFTQVVDANGQVVAGSSTLLAETPISHLRPTEEGTVIHTIPTLNTSDLETRPDNEGPYLLLAEQFPAPPESTTAGPVTVYVAATLHSVDQATATVGLALASGLPVLVLLVGALIWFFGGRALRPVEAIRAEVADISGHDLHRRVPEPQTHDEVAQLARTMNEMLDRLEAASQAQSRFVADASHELRSPLAALHATLEVAATHPSDGTWTSAAADALEESRRLQRLVEDLLVLAHLGEARPNRQEEVDLDEIVLQDVRRRRTASTVRFDLRRVSGGRVIGDPDQLARVVQNLVDNAQRHADSVVAIELSTSAGEVVLAVVDDGPGVPQDQRDLIFERFARLDEGRSQDAGGTGLGLSIVKEIVTAHEGRVGLVDTSSGARFEVRLPAAEPEDGLERPEPDDRSQAEHNRVDGERHQRAVLEVPAQKGDGR
jgi:signal transduction histidine kinase